MKGLTTNFSLRNGRFNLLEGVEKVRDDMNFYCKFDKRRTYLSDYGKNSLTLLHSLEQKPISYLQKNSTLLLGMLKKELHKYVPGVTVKNIDVGYFPENRRHFMVEIDYKVVLADKTEVEDVIFV